MAVKKGTSKAQGEEVKMDIKNIPLSEDSITRELRIGLPSNYINFAKLSPDEITLDFIKITYNDGKIVKDLVSRITLSLANAKALKALLNDQITD